MLRSSILRPSSSNIQDVVKLFLPCRRRLTTSPSPCAKKMPDRPKPPSEDDFTESFLKGTGPGGQKINKTSSAVQLKHLPTGIVLKVQESRSRSQNRKIARQKLAEQLEVLEKGDASRKVVVGRTKAKRKASGVKKSKRKYRLLEEEKEKARKTSAVTAPAEGPE